MNLSLYSCLYLYFLLKLSPLQTICGFHVSLVRIAKPSTSRLKMSSGFGVNKKETKKQKNVRQIISESTSQVGKSQESPRNVERVRFEDAEQPYQNHLPSLNISYPGLKLINNDPPIFEIYNFFTPEMCADYIKRSEVHGYEIASQTFSTNSMSKRTSTTWFLKYNAVTELIKNAFHLTNVPIQNYEEPQIVRYQFGQQFSWHYDYIPQSLLDTSGNRLATLIVYLNDVESGGATCFQALNIQVKPVCGKALLFFPCYRDGKLDDRTMHAGQVTMDTKWIAQIWIHERNYSPKLPPGTSNDAIIDGIQ